MATGNREDGQSNVTEGNRLVRQGGGPAVMVAGEQRRGEGGDRTKPGWAKERLQRQTVERECRREGKSGKGGNRRLLDVLPLSHDDRDGTVVIHLAKVRFTGLGCSCNYRVLAILTTGGWAALIYWRHRGSNPRPSARLLDVLPLSHHDQW